MPPIDKRSGKSLPPSLVWRGSDSAILRGCLLLVAFLLCLFEPLASGQASGRTTGPDEVIPPPPSRYFNDQAGVVPPAVAQQLNEKLEQFERDTSNQIVVAIYPVMQTRSSIEDYTVRIAEAWKVGGKGRDNGAILFVFIKDRKIYIQVGYGLEGVLTDFLCRQIIETEIKPPFQRGDYALGIRNGVNAMIKAAEGEYQGSGRTEDERARRKADEGSGLGSFLFLVLILYLIYLSRSRGGGGNNTRGGGGVPPIFWGGGGFGGGRGGGSSGGGGFRGGGGRFGGGGAGGGW